MKQTLKLSILSANVETNVKTEYNFEKCRNCSMLS